jgi:hypothetical protein
MKKKPEVENLVSDSLLPEKRDLEKRNGGLASFMMELIPTFKFGEKITVATTRDYFSTSSVIK